MSIAKETAKQVEKGAGNRLALKIGDIVQHRLTGLTGKVEEVAQYGDQQILSVRTTTGKLLTKLNRQEFVLSNSLGSLVQLANAPSAPESVGPVSLIEGLIGSISEESILGDLV